MGNYINIVALISGNGSNMENLVKTLHNKTLSLALQDYFPLVSTTQRLMYNNNMPCMHSLASNNAVFRFIEVISNKPDALGLQRAKQFGIPTCIIESSNKTRDSFDKELAKHVRGLHEKCALRFVLFAGFMRILGDAFFRDMPKDIDIVNIHPSFLPLHKGANGIKDSFCDNRGYGGVSVHYVSKDVDSGEIILQEKIEKIHGESIESYEKRVHELEYTIYPLAVLKLISQSPLILNT